MGNVSKLRNHNDELQEELRLLNIAFQELMTKYTACRTWMMNFRKALPIHVFGKDKVDGAISDSYKFEAKLVITAGEIRELDNLTEFYERPYNGEDMIG